MKVNLVSVISPKGLDGSGTRILVFQWPMAWSLQRWIGAVKKVIENLECGEVRQHPPFGFQVRGVGLRWRSRFAAMPFDERPMKWSQHIAFDLVDAFIVDALRGTQCV